MKRQPKLILKDELLISETFLTSGQPTREQFSEVAAEGWQVVINLTMPDSIGAFPDEGDVVRGLGMEYIAIPVVWRAPTRRDLEMFFATLDACRGKKVLAHCALNMRVSSFVFLGRVLRQGMEIETAREDLLSIWQPEGIWQEFIDEMLKSR